jgi:hypothetical protein
MQVGVAEDAHQRVEIAGGNGVVLVIVALRAGDRETQEAARGGIHAVVLHLGAQSIEAEARFVFFVIGKLIAGDLGFHENVVGHVVLNGLNHPIAIAEGGRIGVVALRVEPVVGVAGDIQPETSPALAIARRGEQAIDDLANASGERSCSNASTSSAVGGRPVRS